MNKFIIANDKDVFYRNVLFAEDKIVASDEDYGDETTFRDAYVGETERFSFESGDTQYKFFFYDKMYAHPSAKKHGLDDMAKVNHLFAKPFLEFFNQYKTY
ncbi:MAG: hypothetical protein ACO1N4_04990 [Pedobacter sp.]